MREAFLELVDEHAVPAGLSRHALAELAPLPTERLAPVLAGHRWPCPRELQAIATALGVQPHHLVPDPAEVG
jgi:lambda repressor-like predicted transcriptional regulator